MLRQAPILTLYGGQAWVIPVVADGRIKSAASRAIAGLQPDSSFTGQYLPG